VAGAHGFDGGAVKTWIAVLIAAVIIGGAIVSGAIVNIPDTGENWDAAWQTVEGMRKGQMALSLTNYDSDSIPQIASGSWVEVAGSIYKFTANDSISGSASSGNINYIKMVPSGSGDSAIVTPTWTTDAPTWSDTYQGYYDGTSRYVAGCYYDGTNYKLKWIYNKRDTGPVDRVLNLPLLGERNNTALTDTGLLAYGYYYFANGKSANQAILIGVTFPKRFIVTYLKSYCSSRSAGSVSITLYEGINTDVTTTTMAQTTHSGTGEQTDSSITNPIIDEEDHQYVVRINVETTTTTLYISAIRIFGIEIVR